MTRVCETSGLDHREHACVSGSHHMLLIVEMLLVSLLARYAYRRSYDCKSGVTSSGELEKGTPTPAEDNVISEFYVKMSSDNLNGIDNEAFKDTHEHTVVAHL
jgi:hypothetical protein